MKEEDKRLRNLDRIVSKRFCNHPVLGTFADMFYSNEFICNTVEQPNRNNQRFVSCVPAGVYELIPYSSKKYPDTYALHNPMLGVFATLEEGEKAVKDHPGVFKEDFRYACVLHTANWSEDIQGCIGPGEKLGCGKKKHAEWKDARWMVSNSSSTCKKLIQFIRGNSIRYVEIQDVSSEIIDEAQYYE